MTTPFFLRLFWRATNCSRLRSSAFSAAFSRSSLCSSRFCCVSCCCCWCSCCPSCCSSSFSEWLRPFPFILVILVSIFPTSCGRSFFVSCLCVWDVGFILFILFILFFCSNWYMSPLVIVWSVLCEKNESDDLVTL